MPLNYDGFPDLLSPLKIALHVAQSYPGAQFVSGMHLPRLNSTDYYSCVLPYKQYIGCAQVKITGGGSASPPKIALPGAYQGSDPGITVNIYNNLQSYTAYVSHHFFQRKNSLTAAPQSSPGGAVWSG